MRSTETQSARLRRAIAAGWTFAGGVENADGTGEPQNQPGTGGEPFQLPEKFANKSLEDVARAYGELEKQYGQRSDYDDIKRKYTEQESQGRQYKEALQAWEQYRPHLEKIGWDTRKLDQLATGQAGPAQSQVSMEAWANKWANATPEEQLPYLLNSVIAPLYQAAQAENNRALTTQLQQVFQQQSSYQAQKEKLLFSMLKAVFPDKDIDGIYGAALQKAEQMTAQGFDPFQAVMEGEVSKRQREEDEKALRKQIRAEVEQEFQARSTPTLARSQSIRSKTTGTRPQGREGIRAAAIKAALETAPHLAR